jgi:hypothetical protein
MIHIPDFSKAELFCLLNDTLRADDAGQLHNVYENTYFVFNSYLCSLAASYGSIKCLRYMCEIGGFEKDTIVKNHAASEGQLECLKYAHENGFPWSEMTAACATSSFSVECLKYAHENGCIWSERTTRHAVICNSSECLQFAIYNQCPINLCECYEIAIKISHNRCLDILLNTGVTIDQERLYTILERHAPNPKAFNSLISHGIFDVANIMNLQEKSKVSLFLLFHHVKVLQRAYRRHLGHMQKRKRRAVGIIEQAYLEYSLRPEGRCYKLAYRNFNQLVKDT